MSLFDTPDEPEKKQTAPARAAKQFTEPEPVDANELLTLKNVAHSYMLVETKVQRADLISKLFMQKSVCFDTETTGVDPFLADNDRSFKEVALKQLKSVFQALLKHLYGLNPFCQQLYREFTQICCYVGQFKGVGGHDIHLDDVHHLIKS